MQPYTWDATWAEWDIILHGGRAAWEWLYPLTGSPVVTHTINWLYNIWFLVMFAIVARQMLSGDRARQRQFFLSYLLAWILLGTIMAMAFASAGPCYLERLGLAEGRYAVMMDHLCTASQSYPLPALAAQDYLWQSYLDRRAGAVTGISAMPSMHVSMALLFVLVARNWWLRAALSVFLVAIVVGCVALGWHYAIDAYVAIAGTWGLWWIVGQCLASRRRGVRGAVDHPPADRIVTAEYAESVLQ